jgi:hypothetical protein
LTIQINGFAVGDIPLSALAAGQNTENSLRLKKNALF